MSGLLTKIENLRYAREPRYSTIENEVFEEVKKLQAEIAEWESGALVRGWRETREAEIKQEDGL